ncbi:MAG: DUF359 domain-containing protein [Nitrososphaerota archaeon]
MRKAVFSEELKERVRKPLGRLIPGKPSETSKRLAKELENISGKIIAVGDRVSSELASLGVRVDVYIVDDRIERRWVKPFNMPGATELSCINEPGTISEDAYSTVSKAMLMPGPVVVRVRGEEDLLALVAIIEAPIGSVVLYGQPGVGVVVVDVDEKAKQNALSILRAAS